VGTPPLTFPRDNAEELPPDEPVRIAVNPDNPPWGLLGALGLLILSFVLMAVTQTVLLLPYAVRRGIPLTPQALGEFALKDAGAIFVEIASIIPAHLLTLVLAWLLVTRAGKYPFLRTLGWEWASGFTFWRSAALAVGLLLLGTVIIWLTGSPDNALERMIESSRRAALMTAFAATFTAPIVEEIVFRGVLYSALRRLLGVGWAVGTVLLIFAAIHVPQYWPSFGVIGTILLLSTALTLIRARTGKLLPCFIVHLVFNGIQSLLIVLNPYLERLAPQAPTPAPVPVPAPGLLLELLLRIYGAL
jgi:membrane protease YdiL (CAAX protease family)